MFHLFMMLVLWPTINRADETIQDSEPSEVAHAIAEFSVHDDELETEHVSYEIRGDFNADGSLDHSDIDLLDLKIREHSSDKLFDVNQDGITDNEDYRFWMISLKHTYIGDVNLDGEFNKLDLDEIRNMGTYETNQFASLNTGDLNGDSICDSKDLTFAFQQPGFGVGPRSFSTSREATPEPIALSLAGVVLVFMLLAYSIYRKSREARIAMSKVTTSAS